MDVSVIIVTYNSGACLEACLNSVLAQKSVSLEIIVVDNASSDDTVARAGKFPVQTMANQENIGYGRANNQAFAASTGRLIYLLNPDAELAGTSALADLCAALEQHPQWGMAATRVLSHDGTAEDPPATLYPGQRHVRRDFSRLPGEIAWCLGASMLVRREVYEALGGFDPGFFLYGEDADFGLRVRELGREIGLAGNVAVRHIGGASESGRDPYDVCLRKMTGVHRFWRKHYGAEDAARLARRDRRRSRFRMLTYGLRAWFQPAPSRAWRRLRENRAIWEASVKFLGEK